MGYISLKMKKRSKDYSNQPNITVIVATFNEERVIKQRIENLFDQNYPKNKYEILVVDSASSDNTVTIVKNLINNRDESFPRLKLLIEDERRGKSSALNFAKTYATGDIIVIADANSIYDNNVLQELASNFNNFDVGAVSGRYIVRNSDKSLAQDESFYWEIEHIMFCGESIIDSVSTVVGTISAWRKELVNFNTTTITEDFDMALKVRSLGYKIRYEPLAIAYEKAANSEMDQISQRKRTSIGTIQSIIKNFFPLIKLKNVYFLLILFSHKVLTMLSPFILIGIPILYFLIWDIEIIINNFFITVLTFSILYVLLIKMKTKYANVTKSNIKIGSLVSIGYYVLLNEYIILLAWKDFLFNNYSLLWEKAETTRI